MDITLQQPFQCVLYTVIMIHSASDIVTPFLKVNSITALFIRLGANAICTETYLT